MNSDTSEGAVVLRDVVESDLPLFFEHQLDPEAIRMAAFPSRNRKEFMAHWRNVLTNRAVIKRAIVVDGELAGNIVCFEQFGRRLVGYWLGRRFWGKGIATRALSRFVLDVPTRPLHAFVAKRNTGSIRVLEKCGFTVSGEGRRPDEAEAEAGSEADGEPVDEFVFTLLE